MYNLFVTRYQVRVWVQILNQGSMTLPIHISASFLPFILPKKSGFASSTLKLPFRCRSPPVSDKGSTHHCLLEACSSIQHIFYCVVSSPPGCSESTPVLQHFCLAISLIFKILYLMRVRIIGFFTSAGCPLSCAEWFEQGITKTSSKNCLLSKFHLMFCF